MLIFLFGLPGVGKNYAGEILRDHFGFYFYDADEDLTPPLIEAIHQRGPFPPSERENYFNIVIKHIESLQKKHENIVVAQALAYEDNRQQLKNHFPEATFSHITADTNIVNKRLLARDDWVDIDYANKIREKFESPLIPHKIITNNQDHHHIIQQITTII